MKTLIILGAAAVAAVPLLRLGGDCEVAQETPKSCCGTECETAAPATLASLVLPAAPAVSYDPDSTGSILVKAKFDGEIPEALPDLVIDAEKSKGCDTKHTLDKTDQSRLIAADGSVANVVVTVEVEGEKPTVPAEAIEIDQKGCRFEPHIAVLPAGAKVKFANSDDVNHNVHTFAKKNDALNRNIAGGSSEEQVLAKDEVVEVKCDIHPWMKAWIVVTEAPRYGATGTDGTFKLEGLPPGEYKVKYWHETLGKGTSEAVTVAAGATADLELKLGGDEKKAKRGRK